MILFYSGTGNSRYIAAKIAEVTGDTITDLSTYMVNGRAENHSPQFTSEEPYTVVCPTYCWKIPVVVEEVLRRCSFEGCRSMYFVLTCGDSTGLADRFAELLCNDLNLKYMGLAQVVMPENYIAMFDSPTYDEALRIIYAANQTAETLANYIKYGKPFPALEHSAKDARLTGLNKMFYKLYVSDKKYKLGGDCVGCGKCVSACPLGNIALKDGKPVWNGNCTQCMACISICPNNAIEYGNKSKGKRRYYLFPDGRQKA